MPLLEQRRRACPAVAHRRNRLTTGFLFTTLSIVADLTRRNWALAWSVLHLTGVVAGGYLAVRTPVGGDFVLRDVDPAVVTRVAAGLPLVLRWGPLSGVVGPVSLIAGLVAGWSQERRLDQRVGLAADPAWGSAEELRWAGPAVVRVTGWCGSASGDRWRGPARILDLGSPDVAQLEPAHGDGLMLRGEGPLPEPGAVLRGRLEIRVPRRAPVPGSFDYRGFLSGRGLAWIARADTLEAITGHGVAGWLGSSALSPMRRSLVLGIESLLPAREAALAGAILLGKRTEASRVGAEPFADLGLAHLFAVSGLHVGILLGFLLLPARASGASPWLGVFMLGLTLPVYILLTGMPGSVVRAAGLAMLAVAAKPLGRRTDPLHLLGLLFWMNAVWDPAQLRDTGLRLSYMATGGILALNALQRNSGSGGKSWYSGAAGLLAISLAALWSTLPVVAASFGRVSLISPLANLVTVPLFGIGVWLLVLGLTLLPVWPWAAQASGSLAWLILRSISGLVAVGGQATDGGAILGLPVPGPGTLLGWGAVTGILFIGLKSDFGNRCRWRPVILATLVIGGVLFMGLIGRDGARKPTLRYWQFDVGQGDCGLLTFPDRWRCMIDTAGRFGITSAPGQGPLGRSIGPFLRRQGIRRLDAVILTHGHFDHTGGARFLAQELQVERWYCGGKAGKAIAGLPDTMGIYRPVAGDTLHRWKDWSLVVRYPLEVIGPQDERHENDRSLVVELMHNGRGIMAWSGDLEKNGESHLLESGSPLGPVSIWKAGHHGSNTSGSLPFLSRLDPDLVLVSCGIGNKYGHPNHGPYVLGTDTLEVLRTDLAGSIRLEWDPGARGRWETRHLSGSLPGPP